MKRIFAMILMPLVNLFSFFFVSLFITDYSFLYKKGISNITGFTALFCFLIFVLWLINPKCVANLYLFRIIKWFVRLKDRSLLFIFFIIIVVILSSLGIARHISFSTGGFDMGLFDQALWNTLHGDMLFSSIRGNFCLLGDHFGPILLLLVPFYALKPSVATLVILQAIILALAIFPLYLIAKEKLNSRFLIFAFIISFALSKGLRGVGLSDFHPDAFMVPLSLLAYYFLEKRKNLLFFLSCLLLLSSKESSVLAIAGLGFFALIALKRKLTGAILIITAVAGWAITTKILIPFFNNNNSYLFYVRMPFGKTYSQNLNFAINNFPQFLSFIFMPGKISYVLRLFAPLGFLPLFSPVHYILILMPLVTVLLASSSQSLAGYFLLSSHYVAAILPFVYISGVNGSRNIIRFFMHSGKIPEQTIGRFISVSIIVFSLFFYGKTDVYKFNKFFKVLKSGRIQEKLSYLALIPKKASVCATNNLVPHLSHRKYVYCWLPHTKAYNTICSLTEYIVVDLDFHEGLERDSKEEIYAYIEKAKESGYEIAFSNPLNTFFILHNLHSNNAAVEKFRSNLGMTEDGN